MQKAKVELYLMETKQEKSSMSQGEIRRSYFLKNNEMSMNRRERESFPADARVGTEVS